MTDIKCKYEVCTCAVPHDLCPHPLGWASEDEVRSLAERLCGTFDRFDGFPMEVAREALRWRDETRPVQAPPAAVAAEDAPERVCGAPRDGRECYPTCDCETEELCDYGTKPAAPAQQPAAVAVPEARYTPESIMAVRQRLADAETRQAQQPPAAVPAALHADEVQWIVNDIAELGVMIRGQAFFLYKGDSLVYEDPTHEDDGRPMMFRPVFKREFGECCHPINYSDPRRVGKVSLDDSDDWKPLPPAIDAARKGE